MKKGFPKFSINHLRYQFILCSMADTLMINKSNLCSETKIHLTMLILFKKAQIQSKYRNLKFPAIL